MQPSITRPTPAPAELAPTTSRLRTVTGNPFPRTCSCGCGQPIPRDPAIRYVVDFGAPRPYPTYLREHSPDFGSYRGLRPRYKEPGPALPGFVAASTLPREETSRSEPEAPSSPRATGDPAHTDEGDASPSPQAGRPWASGQLVFNAGQFESARSGFASYAADGETEAQLRARVNRVLLEDLEQKVMALRQLHEKLRDRLEGASFGDVVARGHPR